MHPAVPSATGCQTMTPPAEAVRVFFALSPDRRCAQRLQLLADDLALRLGGRAMQPETLHLTLAFLGDLPADRLPVLLALAGAVADDARQWAPPGTGSGVLRLDRLAYWARQRLLWAGSTSFPPMLRALAGQLAEKTRATGIAVPRSAFVPHVTLVRKLLLAPAESELDLLKDAPLAWPWHEFVLLRSRRSGVVPAYERLGRWKLRAG
ncbi:MAG: RNA 2',3'-cyclic phosphodiesterase [Rhodocyclaceae bacterium]